VNPVVKAQLTAFERANPAHDLSEDALFEVFSIYAVCNGIITDNIDPFSARLNGDEFGLDGVAVMVQGELCRNSDDVNGVLEVGKGHSVEFNLFQSKRSEKSDYGDLSKFFDGAYGFLMGAL
jgi:hypothetical protein